MIRHALITNVLLFSSLICAPLLAKDSAELPTVKIFVLSGFEVGDYTDDAPGEFQFWAERLILDKTLDVAGAPHKIVYNDNGVYGSPCSKPSDANLTTVACSELIMSLLLDSRLDFTNTYWLVNGIAGIDPKSGSIGSAVWSADIIDGDALRELGELDRPNDWSYGLYAIGVNKPGLAPLKNADAGGWGGAKLNYTMRYHLNKSLTEWAYQISNQAVTLKDSKALTDFRAQYSTFAAAMQPPRILVGASLGTARYWHGQQLTQWARDWITLWTDGEARFATTAMEQAVIMGVLDRMSKRGFLDFNRVMMVRGVSNYSMPPLNTEIIESAGDESLGSVPAFEAQYQAGAAVIKEILKNWQQYAENTPKFN